MAQGDANKVWMVPSDYGKALEGFARSLGSPGDDGVFRYEPSDNDGVEQPSLDDDEVASWFDTTTDPKVAQAVQDAEQVARQEVGGPMGGSSSSARPKRNGDNAPAAQQPGQAQSSEMPALPRRQPGHPPGPFQQNAQHDDDAQDPPAEPR